MEALASTSVYRIRHCDVSLVFVDVFSTDTLNYAFLIVVFAVTDCADPFSRVLAVTDCADPISRVLAVTDCADPIFSVVTWIFFVVFWIFV